MDLLVYECFFEIKYPIFLISDTFFGLFLMKTIFFLVHLDLKTLMKLYSLEKKIFCSLDLLVSNNPFIAGTSKVLMLCEVRF